MKLNFPAIVILSLFFTGCAPRVYVQHLDDTAAKEAAYHRDPKNVLLVTIKSADEKKPAKGEQITCKKTFALVGYTGDTNSTFEATTPYVEMFDLSPFIQGVANDAKLAKDVLSRKLSKADVAARLDKPFIGYSAQGLNRKPELLGKIFFNGMEVASGDSRKTKGVLSLSYTIPIAEAVYDRIIENSKRKPAPPAK